MTRGWSRFRRYKPKLTRRMGDCCRGRETGGNQCETVDALSPPRPVSGCRATRQSHIGEILADTAQIIPISVRHATRQSHSRTISTDSTRNCPVSGCRATHQSHHGLIPTTITRPGPVSASHATWQSHYYTIPAAPALAQLGIRTPCDLPVTTRHDWVFAGPLSICGCAKTGIPKHE